jgi:hypothetical protein
VTQGTDALVVKWKELERQWQQQQEQHQEQQRARQQQKHQQQQQEQQQLDGLQVSPLADSISFGELSKVSDVGTGRPLQVAGAAEDDKQHKYDNIAAPGAAEETCHTQAAPGLKDVTNTETTAIPSTSHLALCSTSETTGTSDQLAADAPVAWLPAAVAAPMNAIIATGGAAAEAHVSATAVQPSLLGEHQSAVGSLSEDGIGNLGQGLHSSSTPAVTTGVQTLAIDHNISASCGKPLAEHLQQQQQWQLLEEGTGIDVLGAAGASGNGGDSSVSSGIGLTLVMAAAAAAAARIATPKEFSGGHHSASAASDSGGHPEEQNAKELAELILDAFCCEGGVIAADAEGTKGHGVAHGLTSASCGWGLQSSSNAAVSSYGRPGWGPGSRRVISEEAHVPFHGTQNQSSGRAYLKVTDLTRPPLREWNCRDTFRRHHPAAGDKLDVVQVAGVQHSGVGRGVAGVFSKAAIGSGSLMGKSKHALQKSQGRAASTSQNTGGKKKMQQQEGLPCCFTACKHHLVPSSEEWCTQGKLAGQQQQQQKQHLGHVITGVNPAQQRDSILGCNASPADPTSVSQANTAATGGVTSSSGLQDTSALVDKSQVAQYQQRWQHAVELLHASGVQLAPESLQTYRASQQHQSQDSCRQYLQEQGGLDATNTASLVCNDGWEGQDLTSEAGPAADGRGFRGTAAMACTSSEKAGAAAGSKEEEQQITREVRDICLLVHKVFRVLYAHTTIICHHVSLVLVEYEKCWPFDLELSAAHCCMLVWTE